MFFVYLKSCGYDEGKPNKYMNFLSKISQILLKSPKKRVYLDYASLTPIDKRVLKVVNNAALKYPANPSSLYAEGVAAEKMLKKSREEIAKFFEVHADEIVFTSGGTEANNFVIRGVIDRAIENGIQHPRIISIAIEHPSVRELLDTLARQKLCDVTYVPVDSEGIIDMKELKAALHPETVLVTIMYANNEIGVIQPISEIAKTIRAFKKVQSREGGEGREGSDYPLFHTDACQAAAYCSMRVPALGVDLLAIDGGKVYGPRGIGALYIRRGVQDKIAPQMIGGGQEYDFRAGTENVPAIAGLAEALKVCAHERAEEVARLQEMRDWLITEIKKIVPNAELNGASSTGTAKERLPNNINMCFPRQDAEFLVLRLDAKGVCVSSVTSCRSKSEDSSSYVIEEIGKKECAGSSLRITLGRYTKKEDLILFLKQLKELKIS